MVKILLKKQFMELFRGYFVNKKTGKVRSKQSIIRLIIPFLVIFGSIGYSIYNVVAVMASSFVYMGYEWVYFALTGVMSMGFGVLGSVFNTYASVYNAKDNDLLLSMPIKPSHILTARISSVYLLGLLYSAFIAVPSMIAYWLVAEINGFNIVFPILLLPVSGFVTATLTCILGWCIAAVASKMRNKNVLTIILSVLFLGIYYFFSMKLNSILNDIISNADDIARKIRTIYPLYAYGRASLGHIGYFLVFVLIVGVCFGIVCLVMAKTFIKLTTNSKSAKKKEYKDEIIKAKSVKSTLIHKELKRFVGSPVYLMNCGLGVPIMLILSVVALVKRELLLSYFDEISASSGFDLTGMIPVLICVFVCMITSTAAVTAPSISLEGKSLWILQSLPVNPYEILKAKIDLHLIINLVPGIITTVCFGIALDCSLIQLVLMSLYVASNIWFAGTAELTVNLKIPDLIWTNETVPVKQDSPVLIGLFGGWVISIIIGSAFYFLSKFICAEIFIGIVCVIFVTVTAVLYSYLKNKGSKIFSEL